MTTPYLSKEQMLIVEIGGVRQRMRVNTFSLEDIIEAKTLCSFQVVDLDFNKRFTKGQPVKVYSRALIGNEDFQTGKMDAPANEVVEIFLQPHFVIEAEVNEGEIIFQGVIERSKAINYLPGGALFHNIECIDYHYAADKRLVARAYENENVMDIVMDIWETYLLPEDVTLSQSTYDFWHTGGGVVLEEAVFNYVSTSQALDALAERTGYWWRIDEYLQLHFVERSEYVAPWVLTGEEILLDTLVLESRAPKYRNRQFIRGATDLTSEQIEIKEGNGTDRTFVTGYPVAKVPKVEVDLGGGYEEESVAIKGIAEAKEGVVNLAGDAVTWVSGDGFVPAQVGKIININGNRYEVATVTDDENIILAADSGVTTNGLDYHFPTWYWSGGEPVILQDSLDTEIAAAEFVRVTYRGEFPVVTVSESFTAVAEMRTIEQRGTGRVEDIVDKPQQTTRSSALELAAQLLGKYAVSGIRLKFKTYRHGVRPGHLLEVNLPEYDLASEQFLVEAVEVIDDTDRMLKYTITAIQGPEEGNWAKLFDEIMDRGSLSVREGIGEGEVLLSPFDYSKDWTGEPQPDNIMTVIYPANALFPANTLYPCYAFNDRIKYFEWVIGGVPVGRKVMTTREDMETDSIKTTIYLDPLDAQGIVQEFHWYGGIKATEALGSGNKVAEENNGTLPLNKTTSEAWIINRTDYII